MRGRDLSCAGIRNSRRRRPSKLGWPIRPQTAGLHSCIVAGPAARSPLLLRHSGGPERKRRWALPSTSRRPELRGWGCLGVRPARPVALPPLIAAGVPLVSAVERDGKSSRARPPNQAHRWQCPSEAPPPRGEPSPNNVNRRPHGFRERSGGRTGGPLSLRLVPGQMFDLSPRDLKPIQAMGLGRNGGQGRNGGSGGTSGRGAFAGAASFGTACSSGKVGCEVLLHS